MTSNPPSSQNRADRQELLQVIASNPFQAHPRQARFWHGRVFTNQEEERLLLPPTMTWESPQKPRDDHHNIGTDDNDNDPKSWLTASEYQDEKSVMKLKIQKLAQLLQQSKKTVVYSGAGISVSAGIGQAARGSKKKHPIFGNKSNKATAKPTPTHYALAALGSPNVNLIHGWVQQNHDGLPQKAGFPQDRINEIHGSWFDPSNPVVVYSGSLKPEESEWMAFDAETADLVLVLGTSLSGLNADQVPINAAHRSQSANSLGVVIINLQQTPQDGKASLRIFGSTDAVFRQLFHQMQLKLPKSLPKQYKFPTDKKFLVPYDAQGDLDFVSNGDSNSNNSKNKKENEDSHKMVWDLNIDAKVRIVHDNVHGAGQPSHKPLLAQNPGLYGRVFGWDDDSMSIQIAMSGGSATVFRLGYWWIETAIQGRVMTLPLVNVKPKFGAK